MNAPEPRPRGTLMIQGTTSDAGKSTLDFFFFTLAAGAIYLAITTVSNLVLHHLEKRYSVGVRRLAL